MRKDIDLSEVEKVVEAHRTSLEAFRKGTRRSRGQAYVDWGSQWGSATHLFSLETLVEASARVSIASGRYREGMDLFLDLAQMGGDVARNGDVFAALEGLGIQGYAFNGIKDLLKGGRLGPEDLMELSKELETLDQSFPAVGDVLLNDTMSLGMKFIRAGNLGTFRRDFGGYEHDFHLLAWLRRTVLPGRLLMAEVVLSELPQVRRTLEKDRLAWKEARTAQWTIDEEVLVRHEGIQRPVLGEWTRGFRQFPRDFRHRRAQLRLLHVAARYGATGEILKVADPFGQFLMCREDGRHLKIWSVGPDGIDDHGDGTGSPSWRPGQPDPPSKDIVLEMER